MANYVSVAVIKRLPSYYRYLKQLTAEGIEYISSAELSVRMQLTASQIRQDINSIGGKGRQGFGYEVSELSAHIGHLLGVDRTKSMIIVGAGNIGHALAHSETFAKIGCKTIAIFDNSPDKIGQKIKDLFVKDISELEDFVKDNTVDITVLCVPKRVAQENAAKCYDYGLRAFWNYSPVDISLPNEASIVNVHLDDGLQILSYYMLQKQK